MRILHWIIVLVVALGSPSSAVGLDLFWNDHAGIHRYQGSAPVGPALFETFETRGMAIDPANQRLWWSDVLPLGAPTPGGVIRAGSKQGGSIADVLTHLPSPAGVALDALRGRVFWSDLGDATNPSAIFSANLDGSGVKKLVSEAFISEIAGIAVDPLREKLYFTYINPLIDSLLAGGIARADLDGSNIEPLVGGQGKPIGIAVDAAGGGVYWADALSISPAGGSGAIKAANLDGQNARTILGGLDVPYGIALDLAARYVYWTDMGTGKIQRTTMSGTLPFFEDIVTGLPAPTALVVVPEPDGSTHWIIAAGGIGLAWWSRRRQIHNSMVHSGSAAMKSSSLILSAGALIASWAIFSEQVRAQQVETGEASAVGSPPIDRRSQLYVTNREPLAAAPLIRLPIGSIQPTGWLGKQLELQAAGFHGHLTEISPFLRKERNAWLDREGKGDHGWEEPPYWLKGYLNLACVLRDEAMIRQAQQWIEGALASQKPDGWFGPDAERRGVATDLVGRDDLWPNMIMLFCLQDYYDYSNDKRVIELMERYFKYLQNVPEDRFLIGYWPKHRGGDLLLSVYWLYNRTGDAKLLELAERVHRRTAAWSTGLVDWHNVNIAQGFREPATYAMQSQSPAHRQASYDNFTNIRRLYGQVPGGMFGGDENCRPGYTDPRQAIETCGMVEMMFSTETLAWITGDPIWADRCEDVAYNSLPAALTADLKALRYLTAPNMPLSDKQSKNPGLQNRGPMLLMSPHDHRCCQHNWGHGWPYFAQHQWYATSDHGLAAVFYNSCRLEAKVADGRTAKVSVETRYPFDESVRIRLVQLERRAFPIYLRIPAWCQRPQIKVNGEAVDVEAKPVSFIRLERTWQTGDSIEVLFPMDLQVKRWPENKNCISIERGPLTYSLRIGEEHRRAGGTERWPEWEIFPTSAWNYALVVSEQNPAAGFELVKRDWPANDQPFTLEGTPLELRAKAQRLPEWKLNEQGLADLLPPSPVRSAEEIETVTLVPMGAARLRISAFPVIGDDR